MPSRWISLAILLFWLGVMGPLLVRQLVEQWEAYGEPPGYTIDLVDEAQRGQAEIHWDVRHWSEGSPGEDRYHARSSVVRLGPEDLFDLRVHLDAIAPADGKKPLESSFRITTIDSTNTVTLPGQLRKTVARLVIKIIPVAQECTCQLEGEVRGDGQFYSTLRITTAGPEIFKQLDPVPVSPNGSILNPLHPLNKILGIQPGQRWSIPVFNPLRDALGQVFGQQVSSASPSRLTGYVLPEPQTLHWDRSRDVSCLVIEYTRGGERVAHTWVELTSGLVLKQEARLDGDVWEFLRTSDFEGL